MTCYQFISDLESGRTPDVCLFTGPDSYGKREAMDKLCATLLPEGLEELNYTVLEDAAAEKIVDAALTLPVMCDKRIVEVRDWAPFFSGKSKNEEAEADRLLKYLESPAQTCVLVFNTRTEPDGKKRLTKAFADGKAGVKVDFPIPGDPELQKWCSAVCKSHGSAISRTAADRLIFTAGRDRTRLLPELEKLCSFAGPSKEITPGHVDSIVTPSLESSIFRLTDLLLEDRFSEALSALDTLISSGENRVYILAALSRQMRSLTHIRLAMDENHLSETQDQLGLKAYPAKMLARQAQMYPAACFQRLYEACIQTDFDIKSGKLREREALNAIILQIHREFSKNKGNKNIGNRV